MLTGPSIIRRARLRLERFWSSGPYATFL